MRAALLQLSSSDDPDVNLADVSNRVSDAAADGAQWVLTPEVTNLVSLSRRHQMAHLTQEQDDPFLAAMRNVAAKNGVWLSLGSLAVKTDDPDGRFANRSFLINPTGDIVARYDKIHMFDVAVSPTETYRESAGFRPGDRAVLAKTDFGTVGLTVCYDVRFPSLFRSLAQSGAQFITVPAAFSPVTGRAHWEPLLRARAIENGVYILAAAQTGLHPSSGKRRETYGHSMVISPWGDVLADAGTDVCTIFVDLEPEEVAKTRGRIPSLLHDREFLTPNEQPHE